MINESAVDRATTRHGYFRGPVFLHPDLKFQYRFPEAWSTWNERGIVIGLSSMQDAIIKLRVVAGTPAEAAGTFFRQPGFEADGISDTAINGLPARTGTFITDTGLGTARGIATFIAYGDATYEVLASAISDAFDRYVSVFRRSITTFDRLNGSGVDAAASGSAAPARETGAVRVTPLHDASDPGPDSDAGSIPRNQGLPVVAGQLMEPRLAIRCQ